jgi:hypothetical protein
MCISTQSILRPFLYCYDGVRLCLCGTTAANKPIVIPRLIFYCFNGVSLCLCGTWVPKEPIVHPPHDRLVNMEQRWNYTDRRKPKDSEKNLSQCHFDRHKSHMD